MKHFNKKGQALAEVHGFIYALCMLLAVIVFFTAAIYSLGQNSTNKLELEVNGVDSQYIILDLMDSQFLVNEELLPSYIVMQDAIRSAENKISVVTSADSPTSSDLNYVAILNDNLQNYFSSLGTDTEWFVWIMKVENTNYAYDTDYFTEKFLFQKGGGSYDESASASRAYFQLPYNGEKGFKYIIELGVKQK